MQLSIPFSRALRPAVIAGLALAATAVSGCTVNNQGDNEIAGKQLFVQKCGSCHILGRAGTKGVTGPNLDEAFREPLKEGFGRESVRGVVYHQIRFPARGGVMPKNLVNDGQARDIAAYVAGATAAKGKDTGLLATAVKAAGSDKPAIAVNGVLTIPADPGGQLVYVNKTAEAPAGKLTIVMPNESGIQHNIEIDGKGASPIIQKGEAKFTATFTPGKYTYFCAVPGHRQAGMEGTLTVK